MTVHINNLSPPYIVGLPDPEALAEQWFPNKVDPHNEAFSSQLGSGVIAASTGANPVHKHRQHETPSDHCITLVGQQRIACVQMPGIMSDGDLTSGRRNSSPSIGQQSLLTAMNNFVSAVDEMDGAVMIPCRLQDMRMATTPSLDTGKAVIPFDSNNSKTDSDLYTYYTMLNAVKTELVRGPRSEEEEMEEENECTEQDEISKNTAKMFRHHLRGLFNVLKQMTDTADYLRGRYQEDVGDTSTYRSRHIAAFTL